MSGRIRSIKPEILDDEKTASLPSDAWRLFVSLWLLADDYGNTHASPKRIRAACFWALENVDFDAAMARLTADRLIVLYETDGQRYLHIVGWSKHQKVDKPGKPHCPAPPADAAQLAPPPSDPVDGPKPDPIATVPEAVEPAKEVPAKIRETPANAPETVASRVANVRGALAPDRDRDRDQDQDQEDDRCEAATPDEPWGVQNRVRVRGVGRIDERVQGERERALAAVGAKFGWPRLVADLDAICDCAADDAGLEHLKTTAQESGQKFTPALGAWLGKADAGYPADALFSLARIAKEWRAKRRAPRPEYKPPAPTGTPITPEALAATLRNLPRRPAPSDEHV